MKVSMKYLAVLVAVLMVSSAVFASQGNAKSCRSASSEGAIWAGSLDSTQMGAGSCPSSEAGTLKTQQGSNAHDGTGRIIENAKGLLHHLGSIIDGAIWNILPPPPK